MLARVSRGRPRARVYTLGARAAGLDLDSMLSGCRSGTLPEIETSHTTAVGVGSGSLPPSPPCHAFVGRLLPAEHGYTMGSGGDELPIVPEPVASRTAAVGTGQNALPSLPPLCSRVALPLAAAGRLPVVPKHPTTSIATGGIGRTALTSFSLPCLPELGGSVATAVDNSQILPALGGSDCERRVKRQKLAKRPTLRERHHTRPGAFADIARLAQQFGEDLLTVPSNWISVSYATSELQQRGVASTREQPLLLEIFAGCANLTRAVVGAGWQACPPVDINVAFGTGPGLDLLTNDRRFVWHMLAVCKPAWVHLAFPCTFWSPMAHFTRQRPPEEDEQSRTRALVFITFARQVVLHQVSLGHHASFEQPPACISWSLDIVQDIVTSANMKK